eukprot:11355891-Heterocapsa_arctica.AAC.1
MHPHVPVLQDACGVTSVQSCKVCTQLVNGMSQKELRKEVVPILFGGAVSFDPGMNWPRAIRQSGKLAAVLPDTAKNICTELLHRFSAQ